MRYDPECFSFADLVTDTDNIIEEISCREFRTVGDWSQVCAIINGLLEVEQFYKNGKMLLAAPEEDKILYEVHYTLREGVERGDLACDESHKIWCELIDELQLDEFKVTSVGGAEISICQTDERDWQGQQMWMICLFLPMDNDGCVIRGNTYFTYFRGLGCIPPYVDYRKLDWYEQMMVEASRA